MVVIYIRSRLDYAYKPVINGLSQSKPVLQYLTFVRSSVKIISSVCIHSCAIYALYLEAIYICTCVRPKTFKHISYNDTYIVYVITHRESGLWIV